MRAMSRVNGYLLTPKNAVRYCRMSSQPTLRILDFISAFATIGLLTLMVGFNGTLAITGTLLFASLLPHVTGPILAIIVSFALRPAIAKPTTKIPWWAYVAVFQEQWKSC